MPCQDQCSWGHQAPRWNTTDLSGKSTTKSLRKRRRHLPGGQPEHFGRALKSADTDGSADRRDRRGHPADPRRRNQERTPPISQDPRANSVPGPGETRDHGRNFPAHPGRARRYWRTILPYLRMPHQANRLPNRTRPTVGPAASAKLTPSSRWCLCSRRLSFLSLTWEFHVDL